MTVLAQDSFTYSDGSLEQVSSFNFDSKNSTNMIQVASNAIYAGQIWLLGTYQWTGNTFPDDQYAQLYITFGADLNDSRLGPAVRVGATGWNCYAYEVSSVYRGVNKVVASSVTNLTNYTGAGSSATYRLECRGTVIRPMIDGVLDSNLGQTSDSSLSSGYAGLYSFSLNANNVGDNWEGGDFRQDLPVSDSFTYSNGELSAVAPNWTMQIGNIQVSSNVIYPNSTSAPIGYYWNASTFPNNQYSQIELLNFDSITRYQGVAVRMDVSSDTYYLYYASNAWRIVAKIVDGIYTSIGAYASSGVIGTYKLEASGTTLTPYLNGSLDSDVGAQTDSSIASGSAGISAYGQRVVHTFDNWSAGWVGPFPTNTVSIAANPSGVRKYIKGTLKVR